VPRRPGRGGNQGGVALPGHRQPIVAPAELEAMLISHPAIADAAVVGSPDKMAGEVPKAFVARRSEVSDVELMDYVASRVAAYKGNPPGRVHRADPPHAFLFTLLVDDHERPPMDLPLAELLRQPGRPSARVGEFVDVGPSMLHQFKPVLPLPGEIASQRCFFATPNILQAFFADALSLTPFPFRDAEPFVPGQSHLLVIHGVPTRRTPTAARETRLRCMRATAWT